MLINYALFIRTDRHGGVAIFRGVFLLLFYWSENIGHRLPFSFLSDHDQSEIGILLVDLPIRLPFSIMKDGHCISCVG